MDVKKRAVRIMRIIRKSMDPTQCHVVWINRITLRMSSYNVWEIHLKKRWGKYSRWFE